MIRYAGVNLVIPTAAAVNWCEQFIDPRDTMEFAHRTWPGPTTLLMSWPQFLIPRRVKPGTLYWPTGAARWAVGWFFATENQLTKIRDQCYGRQGEYLHEPKLLELQTPHGTINPLMYMLPPRAVSGMRSSKVKANGLYLLTLVDARYFLQWQDIGEAAATDWEDLLSMIELTPLFPDGITREAIEPVYQGPSRTITTTHSEPLGPLLDSIAWNTGRRLVRNWHDESWELQKAARAKALLTENQTKPRNRVPRAAGRAFRFGTVLAQDEQPIGAQRELGSVLPQTVRVLFPPSFDDPYPQVLTSGWNAKDVTAASCGYATINASTPMLAKVFHDDLGTDAASDTDLTNLAQQIAQDYYDWRYDANFDICYDGMIPWQPDALTDCIEWTYTADACYTRVQRGVWNGDPGKFNHAAVSSGSGSSGSVSGSGCPRDTTIQFVDECTGCVRTVKAYDRFGGVITFEICTDCSGSGV